MAKAEKKCSYLVHQYEDEDSGETWVDIFSLDQAARDKLEKTGVPSTLSLDKISFYLEETIGALSSDYVYVDGRRIPATQVLEYHDSTHCSMVFFHKEGKKHSPDSLPYTYRSYGHNGDLYSVEDVVQTAPPQEIEDLPEQLEFMHDVNGAIKILRCSDDDNTKKRPHQVMPEMPSQKRALLERLGPALQAVIRAPAFMPPDFPHLKVSDFIRPAAVPVPVGPGDGP